MLLVCMVGQPMAFSMHPFDVDSWAKNGDDAQLESVLGLVAQVSEQDPKELAEDVRSMSGPVRNRMHDYPGTSLLEAWEAEALTHEDFTPTPKHPHNIWIIRTCVVLGVGVGFIWESLVFDQNESHPQRFPDILMIQICWSCWGWGWGLHQSEADGRFKGGRVKAASESLYAIKAINRGTGSLESRFHKGQQLNSKKHMSEDSMEGNQTTKPDASNNQTTKPDASDNQNQTQKKRQTRAEKWLGPAPHPDDDPDYAESRLQ